eukprot:UN30890
MPMYILIQHFHEIENDTVTVYLFLVIIHAVTAIVIIALALHIEKPEEYSRRNTLWYIVFQTSINYERNLLPWKELRIIVGPHYYDLIYRLSLCWFVLSFILIILIIALLAIVVFISLNLKSY